jgi:hypothetical protein
LLPQREMEELVERALEKHTTKPMNSDDNRLTQ